MRVTRAGAGGALEADGLVFELVQGVVKTEPDTEKAAALLEQHCGGEHAVRLYIHVYVHIYIYTYIYIYMYRERITYKR